MAAAAEAAGAASPAVVLAAAGAGKYAVKQNHPKADAFGWFFVSHVVAELADQVVHVVVHRAVLHEQIGPDLSQEFPVSASLAALMAAR